MTRSIFRVSSAAALLPLVSCIVRGGDSHPLYPGPERAPSEVARLVGPIGEVDGQDVSKLGKAFALLPGCHVAKLASKTGAINTLGGGGGYVANLPPALYAFRMQPRHTYEIEVVVDPITGPTGTLTLRAWDRDRSGGASEVSPVTSTAQIDECMKWRP
jgi:hypothetical protein